MKKILVVFGTRPEAIKLAPLISGLINSSEFNTFVCSTGQHREMLDQVLQIFDINVDINLNLMTHNQDLFDITANTLIKLKEVFLKEKPDLVIVQGDTSTAFVASLAAFYLKIKVAHIEAGLRSFNNQSPFPEEVNRKLITVMSDFHFAPTGDSKMNLILEGINPEKIFITGNTVIDSLYKIKNYLQLSGIQNKIVSELTEKLGLKVFDNPFILITLHRREKFGEEFNKTLNIIKDLALQYKNYNFIYPVHLNTNVQESANKILADIANVILIKPQNYLNFIYLMNKCLFIMTDSGGVQEESFVFRKPIIILRDVTERMEAIKAGYAFLVGSDERLIKTKFHELINNSDKYFQYFNGANPFGDGTASKKIIDILLKSSNLYD